MNKFVVFSSEIQAAMERYSSFSDSILASGEVESGQEGGVSLLVAMNRTAPSTYWVDWAALHGDDGKFIRMVDFKEIEFPSSYTVSEGEPHAAT